MKSILAGLIIVVVIVGGFFYLVKKSPPSQNSEYATSTVATTTQNLSVEEYIRQNISAISPESAQVGGTFYVTAFEAHNGTGTVSFEDGHVAHTADFTYTTDRTGKVSVVSFTLRK
jgi:hypothetical protein